MNYYRSIIYVLLAMFAFAMMALFTREANADVLTIATWRAILVAVIFGLGAFTQGELRFFTEKESKPSDLDETNESSPEKSEQKKLEQEKSYPDLSQKGLFSKEHLKISIPYGLFLGVASSTFVGGYAFTTVANTIFLHNLAPMFAIPLVFWMFSERTNSNVILGAVISVFGVALISGVSLFHATHLTNPRFLLGDFLALVSAVGYAGVLVWTQACRRYQLPILGTLFVSWSAAAVLLVVLTLAMGSLSISWTSFWWILGLAFFCTNLPFTLLSQGMKQVSAGMASLLSMSEVVFATALGVVLYHETLAPIGWLGGVLVTLGVLYPFFQTAQSDAKTEYPDHLSLGEGWLKLRSFRVGFWVLMLNCAAVLGVVYGSFVATVGVLLVLCQLARPTVSALLDYRFKRVEQSVMTLFAIALLGIIWSGDWLMQDVSLIVVLGMGLLVDDWFAKRERNEGEHIESFQAIEGNPTLYLSALVLSGLAELMGHQFSHIAMFAFYVLASLVVVEQIFHVWSLSRKNSFLVVPKSPMGVGLFIVAAFFTGGVYIVPAGHQALIERLGVEHSISKSGLLLRMPPPIERVYRVDVERVHSVDVFPVVENVLCADQSMISIQAVIQYSISDVSNYEYRSKDSEQVLLREARKVIVNQARKVSHEKMFQERGLLEQSWEQILQKEIEQLKLGLTVEGLMLNTVTVPVAVKDDFLDVVSAKEDQSTRINQAQAEASSSIPLALGEAVSIHEQAVSTQLEMIQEAQSWALIQKSRMSEGSKDRLYLDWLGQSIYHSDYIKAPIINNAKSGSNTVYLGIGNSILKKERSSE